jgi:hypothetical protein
MWGTKGLVVGGIAALAVLTAACTTQTKTGQAETGPTAATTPATVFIPVTAAAATTPPPLRFPNTDLTVRFTGYDDTAKMVTFVLVTWIPGGADDGHYASNASDSGPHRLPLAAGVTITSWSSDCAGNGGDGGTGDDNSCTADQLVAGLHAGGGGLSVAALHVDSTDHVSNVREIFTP